MKVDELPLLNLFHRLREADFPLGIDDYQLLLHALQGGFGISDRDALARLCRTLWVKSEDDAYLFDYHFEQVMAQTVASLVPAESPEEPDEAEEVDISNRSTLPLSQRRATGPLPTVTAEPVLKVEDDVRVAQAISSAAGHDESAYSAFLQTDEYLPVTRRQMKQSWRHLRRPIREGPPVELDGEATVQTIGRQGMLLDVVLVPRRINRAELLLLIDQGGSMVPFHVLSHRLVETAVRGGRLGNTDIYYFHNCPWEYLYRDPAHNRAELLQTVLHQPHHEQAGILIFSDAGAARGDFNWERSELTAQFLQQCRQQFRYLAWLNPVPAQRWPGTTAGEIMHMLPMFDVSRRGLDNAISALCGRLSHFVHTTRYTL